MKVEKVWGGYVKITDGNVVAHVKADSLAELIEKSTRLREDAARDIRRAERMEYAAVVLQIEAQMAEKAAATQKRERAAATRQSNKDARWWT